MTTKENERQRKENANTPYVLCLSVEDAMRAIGIKRTKLYELVNQGELKSITIGGRRLFRKVDLEAFVNNAFEKADREELSKKNAWRCKSCGATNLKNFGICLGCHADEPLHAS